MKTLHSSNELAFNFKNQKFSHFKDRFQLQTRELKEQMQKLTKFADNITSTLNSSGSSQR